MKEAAIHRRTEHGGQLILTADDYSDFRLILKSRLLSDKNHLGVCFWGKRYPDWQYGDCILVVPPTGGMWDYHPGKKGPPREKLPHLTSILTSGMNPRFWLISKREPFVWR